MDALVAINEMINGYEAALQADAVRAKRTSDELLAAAEVSARNRLPELFGDAWKLLQPYVKTGQVFRDRVTFEFDVEALELADFSVVFIRHKDDWKFYGFDGSGLSSTMFDSVEMLFAHRRRKYQAARKTRLLGELRSAMTEKDAHEAAALLLLHEPEDEAAWIETRDQRIAFIREREAEDERTKKALTEYAEAYRAYLVRREEVKKHNQAVVERVRDVLDAPRVLRELEYGVLSDGEVVSVESEWVTDQIPEDGWYTLHDGSKKRFFYPVSLGDARKIRPSDRIYGLYDAYWCRHIVEVLQHWPGEDVEAILQREGILPEPDPVDEPIDLAWGSIEATRRAVERELAAQGIIQLND